MGKYNLFYHLNSDKNDINKKSFTSAEKRGSFIYDLVLSKSINELKEKTLSSVFVLVHNWNDEIYQSFVFINPNLIQHDINSRIANMHLFGFENREDANTYCLNLHENDNS